MESLFNYFKNLGSHFNYMIMGIPLYRVIFAFFVFFLFLFLRKLFLLIVVKLIERLTRKTATDIDDRIVKCTSRPLSVLIIAIGIFIAGIILGIPQGYVWKLIRSVVIIVFSWTAYNLVTEFEYAFYKFAEKFGKDISREIGNFLVKVLKIFSIGLGALAILQEWGINVSALMASLGLGGLAFALAAKDTVANLFGGLTVLIDKSMKVGDWIKIGDVEGIVEDIGLRTTKIRSFEKSLIVIPNQVLANQSLENFSRRKVRRIKMLIGLTYDTPREKMVKILQEIREMLRNHPGIAKDQLLMVYFTEFADSSLNIFIYCFTNTAVWADYLAIREDVNLKIMEIVERNGASFAFPSTSIYVEKLPEKFFEPMEKEGGRREGAEPLPSPKENS
jgi:MscS family membrane protein